MKKEIAKLIDKRNYIVKCNETGDMLVDLEYKIADMEAIEIRNKLLEVFNQFSDNSENISVKKMWKLLNNISPKVGNEAPTAKINHKGKLISGAKNLKILMLNEYKQRLRNRPVRPDLGLMGKRKDKIFNLKMELARRKKTPDFTMKDLENALSKLKNNKSRDSLGYINEIFKPETIGDNLKASLLNMFNLLKRRK